MAVELVFETHCTTEDNEQEHATGWLPGRLSQRASCKPVSWGNDAAAMGSPPAWDPMPEGCFRGIEVERAASDAARARG